MINMKVYLLLQDNEPFYPENLLLVGRKSDAEKLIKDGFATYYEIIDVLSGADVDEYYKTRIARG